MKDLELKDPTGIELVIKKAHVSKAKRLASLLTEVEYARSRGVQHQDILEWLRSTGLEMSMKTYLGTLDRIKAKAAEQKASCVAGTSPAPISGSAPTIKQPLIQAVGSGLQAQGSNSLMPDKRFTHDAKGTAPEW